MHASAIEATAALAGIAAVAGASSRQIIGGVVPKKMTRVADRSYYGPWSAKGLNLPATWSVTPGGAARRRDREVRANATAAAAHPPNASLNEALAQLAAGVSFRNPRESSAGHRAGLISDVAASSGEEVDSNNETALPPFQSAVETSGGYRINPGDEGTVPMLLRARCRWLRACPRCPRPRGGPRRWPT